MAAAETPATQPEIQVGHAYRVQLQPTVKVEYTVPMTKLKDAIFGGLFMLTIDSAGTYAVGIDQDAWINMVRDGQALKSSAHAHGPACSTLHKTVDYALIPGHYSLKLSNSAK